MRSDTRPDRLHILGVPVDGVDMARALAFVDEHVAKANSPPGYILAVNPEKVFAVRESPFLSEFFRDASLLIPDGVGVVVALRLLAGVRARRVAGADLMQAICARSARTGHRLFVFGSSEEVNRAAVEQLRLRYPGIHIVGRANGYLQPDEMDGLIDTINASRADILFVALGSPRQEQWLRDHLPRLSIRLAQGVGGTLDTIAGTVKRAPVGFQRLGLEWFYRLLREPRRIARQRRLPLFAVEVLREVASRRWSRR